MTLIKIKNIILVVILCSAVACTKGSGNVNNNEKFISLMVRLITTDFENMDGSDSNDVNKAIEYLDEMKEISPDFTQFSGTDVNTTCRLLRFISQISPDNLTLDQKNKSKWLNSSLLEKIKTRKYAHNLYPSCREVYELEVTNPVGKSTRAN